MQVTFPKPIARPVSLHPDTNVGQVHLAVRDFKTSLPWYQQVLGFKVHRQENGTAYLGAGGDDILILTEKPGAKLPGKATGLYHFAILVPSRFELARSLRRMGESDVQLGFGDHIVSEAIYLSDPDGNGIEVYADRPRTNWYDKNGNFQMGTLPVDVKGVLGELANEQDEWQGLHRDTVLGHMHLKVANPTRDAAFYRDVIGLDEMANMGTAAFLSAGGYHHHLGMNSWESANAAPPSPDSVGLQWYTINLPNAEELSKVAHRVRRADFPLQETETGLLVRDPSQNAAILTTKQNTI